MATLLEVRNLCVGFHTGEGFLKAVDNIEFSVFPGESVSIVGESGSGKSMTAHAVMGLVPEPPGEVSGETFFDGKDLQKLEGEELRRIRGAGIAMVFQEPMTSLNPVLAIGTQLREGMVQHLGLTTRQADKRAVELLKMVGISEAERRLKQYPHHFSGGMRQRVMIATAISCEPKLIIADEPTTALDVTIQAQILDLMKVLSERLGAAMILITHNLGIVARYTSRVNVMYAGRIVESANTEEIFARPSHPYTQGLLGVGAEARQAPERGPAADPGPAARLDPLVARLRLRATLSDCRGALCPGPAAPRPDCQGSSRGLHRSRQEASLRERP